MQEYEETLPECVMLLQGILPEVSIFENAALCIRPHVICRDGFRISVQASPVHNCYPPDRDGPYTHVELGFPNRPLPPEFDQYGDDYGVGVYSRVPVSMVKRLIDAHGGIVNLYFPMG